MIFLAFFFGASALAGSLDGIWLQDCANGYQREETLAGATAVYRELNYFDQGCSQPSVETISRGTISVGAPAAGPAGALEIDFVFSGVALRPRDEYTAAVYRAGRVCGIADWAVGEERNVTGLACDLYGLKRPVRVPALGDRRFGIVKAGEGVLYFGKLSPARSGATSEQRPEELDPQPYRFVPVRN